MYLISDYLQFYCSWGGSSRPDFTCKSTEGWFYKWMVHNRDSVSQHRLFQFVKLS